MRGKRRGRGEGGSGASDEGEGGLAGVGEGGLAAARAEEVEEALLVEVEGVAERDNGGVRGVEEEGADVQVAGSDSDAIEGQFYVSNRVLVIDGEVD